MKHKSVKKFAILVLALVCTTAFAIVAYAADRYQVDFGEWSGYMATVTLDAEPNHIPIEGLGLNWQGNRMGVYFEVPVGTTAFIEFLVDEYTDAEFISLFWSGIYPAVFDENWNGYRGDFENILDWNMTSETQGYFVFDTVGVFEIHGNKDGSAVVSVVAGAPAQPTAGRILRFAIGSTTFTDNGVSNTLEAAPFIAEDRTMAPLRVIVEALGATGLTFNYGVITFNLNGETISMTVGQPLPNNMGTPMIVEGRTFVPLAYIMNEIGAVARWDNDARAAYIYVD